MRLSQWLPKSDSSRTYLEELGDEIVHVGQRRTQCYCDSTFRSLSLSSSSVRPFVTRGYVAFLPPGDLNRQVQLVPPGAQGSTKSALPSPVLRPSSLVLWPLTSSSRQETV